MLGDNMSWDLEIGAYDSSQWIFFLEKSSQNHLLSLMVLLHIANVNNSIILEEVRPCVSNTVQISKWQLVRPMGQEFLERHSASFCTQCKGSELGSEDLDSRPASVSVRCTLHFPTQISLGSHFTDTQWFLQLQQNDQFWETLGSYLMAKHRVVGHRIRHWLVSCYVNKDEGQEELSIKVWWAGFWDTLGSHSISRALTEQQTESRSLLLLFSH